MKLTQIALTLTAASLLGGPAIAEDPSPLITIGREAIKEGRSAAHEKVETDWARTFRKAKFPFYWLGMNPMTGTNEVWFINFYKSYAEMEKADKLQESTLKNEAELLDARDGELRSGSHSMIGEYRKSLSYRGDRVNMGKVRYGVLTVFHVKLGYRQDFRDGYKLIHDALEKADYPFSSLCYEIVGGARDGTYHSFMPLESLAALDSVEQYDKKFREAIGADQYTKLSKGMGDVFDSVETTYFRVSPNMSYLPAEVESVDPDYWRPKTAAPAKPANKPNPAPAKPGQ